MQPSNATDRELPLLLWYGLAGLMPEHLDRAFALVEAAQVPNLSDYVHWYAAKLSHEGRDEITKRLVVAGSDEQFRLLSLLELGVRGMRGLPQPQRWTDVATRLYASSDVRTKRAAESLGAAFGDAVLFQRMRDSLADRKSNLDAKRHAVSILSRDSSPENLRLFLALLNTRELVPQVLPLLTRFNDPAIA